MDRPGASWRAARTGAGVARGCGQAWPRRSSRSGRRADHRGCIPFAVFALDLADPGRLVSALPDPLPNWLEWLGRLAIGAAIMVLGVALGSRLPLTVRLPAPIVVAGGIVGLCGWTGFWILVVAVGGPRAA